MDRRTEIIWAKQSRLHRGQQMQEHCHPCHQLYYVLEGKAIFVLGGEEIEVRQGSCFLVPAMMPHRMLPLEEKTLQVYEMKILVKDEFILRHLKCAPEPLKDEGILVRTLTYVMENWNCPDEQNRKDLDYLLSSVLLNFFVGDIHYEKKDSAYIETGEYGEVTRGILVYVEKQYPFLFRLQDLADRMNYHKNYLCAVFKKDTGVSIVDYLNFIRIRQSIILFSFYGQDVGTVYESVGFSNPSHFSRTFKALVGIPPREFRGVFLRIPREEIKMYFAKEPVLNYQSCTMEEAFASLKRIGAQAGLFRKKL